MERGEKKGRNDHTKDRWEKRRLGTKDTTQKWLAAGGKVSFLSLTIETYRLAEEYRIFCISLAHLRIQTRRGKWEFNKVELMK